MQRGAIGLAKEKHAPKFLVAVDTPAKSFTFLGSSGKPTLISTKKLKSKDPIQ